MQQVAALQVWTGLQAVVRAERSEAGVLQRRPRYIRVPVDSRNQVLDGREVCLRADVGAHLSRAAHAQAEDSALKTVSVAARTCVLRLPATMHADVLEPRCAVSTAVLIIFIRRQCFAHHEAELLVVKVLLEFMQQPRLRRLLLPE